ncbi:MAG: hypothetical protein TRG1_3237 [Flavobacteriaceae bacterium FS1-H7996/R]|nr:MAG: hypothetical protein TRG1_3237 [Flavobacteriaceae bacterium FS1-H7996/R]
MKQISISFVGSKKTTYPIVFFLGWVVLNSSWLFVFNRK